MQSEGSGVKQGLRRGTSIFSAFGFLTGTMNSIGTVWILALMVLINADIFSRFILNAPIRGVAEIVTLSIVGIVFLQIAHTLRAGRIMRAELLLTPLRERVPRIAITVDLVHHLVGTTIFGILFFASWKPFRVAWLEGYYLGSPGDFTAPTWPIKFLVFFGAGVMTVQFIFMSLKLAVQLFSSASEASTEPTS
jgi:TRAP-type mannitol/chloroaromatic compound transport system permease small subunit